jgi:hypothetical protein
MGFLNLATGTMFVIELVLPFLIFAPRRLRFCAAFGILPLEFLILITGNYNWFNLQTHAALLAAILRCDAAKRVAAASRRAESGAPQTAPRGRDRRQCGGSSDRPLQPGADGSALRRHPADLGAGDHRLGAAAEYNQPLRPILDHDHSAMLVRASSTK